MDGEVRIPIFLDFNSDDMEKEISKVTPKLHKLKSSMDSIFKNRSEDIKLFDTAKLLMAERQIAKIRDRLKEVTDEEKKDAAVSAMIGRNIEVYKGFAEQLDKIINKYPELRKEMQSVSSVKVNNWANTTNSKELLQYIEALQKRLAQVRTTLEESPKGNTVLDTSNERITKNIESVEELISKIGEYQQALSEAETTARKETSAISAMRKSGASDEEIAEQKRVAKAARDANSEMEKSSAGTTDAIKRDIHERMQAILEEEKVFSQVAERIRQTNDLIDRDNNGITGEKNVFRNKASVDEDVQESVKALSQEEEELADAEDKVTEATGRESKATKNSTANYYYKLRAVKMLGFVFGSAYRAVDSFGKKSLDVAKKTAAAYARLLPGVSLFRLATLRAANSQKKLTTSMKSTRKELKSTNKEVKNTTNTHEGFNFSLKKAIKSILAYGFGIRSLYMLMRKLRSAIKDGLGEMSQQFEDVNERMSSILTSINYIKATLTTIVEPMLTLVAPALEKISELVANISYHVASFIAALSGQKNVYKAVKVQADYAESLDKTAKNAKKARKELAGFDELNVLHSDDDDEKEYTMGWELVPALQEALPILDKIKDILSKLFEPILNAWNKMKDFVISSWKYAMERLKSLAGAVWDDFLKVWQDPKTQKIFEDLFKIIGDIGLIVGNLAGAFEEAWRHANNGYRILSSLRDIIGIIVDGIRRCADATVIWSEKLSFIPLLSAIADVLEKQIVPAVQKVVDLFVYLYETVILELARYLIEELAPKIVQIVGNIIETIGMLASKIHNALVEADRGERIVQAIESVLTIVADTLLRCSERTKEWAEKLNVVPLIDAITNVLTNQVVPAVEKVSGLFEYLYNNVILELARYFIEDLGPIVVNVIGGIIEIIGNLSGKITEALDTADRGKIIIESIESIISIIALGINECVQKTIEWSNTINFDTLFATIASVLQNQVVPAVQKIVDLFVALYNNLILPLATYVIETLGPKFIEIFGNISETIGNIAENIKKAFEENGAGERILSATETIISTIADKLIDVTSKTKEWAKELDFSKLTDAFARFLENTQPAISTIVDIFGKFWTDVLLPFWKYIIETGGPKLLDIVGELISKLDWESIKESVDTLFGAFEQFLELGWETLLQIIQDVGDKISEFVDSGHLKTLVDWFSEWVNKADPETLAGKIEKFVVVFADLYAGLAITSKVIMPVVTGFMTLFNVFNNVGVVNSIKGLTAAIGGGAGAGTAGGTGLLGAIGGLAIPIGIVIGLVAAMVQSFGGVKETVAEVKERFDNVKEAVSQFAEKLNFGDKLDRLKDTFDRIKTSLQEARPIFEFLLDVLAGIAQVITETLMGAVSGLIPIIDGAVNIIKGFVDAISGALEMIGALVLWFSGDKDGAKALAEKGWSDFIGGLSETAWGILEAIEGVIEGIALALAGFVDYALPGVSEKISKFADDVKGFFEKLKHALIGDPIVYDIRDGVIEGFGEFVSKTIESIGGWVKDVLADFGELKTNAIEKFNEMKTNIIEKAGEIKENVVTKFGEMKENLGEKVNGAKDFIVEKFTALKEGMLGKSDEATTQTEQDFSDMDSSIKEDLNSTSLSTTGIEYIQGLQTGIATQFPLFIEDLTFKLTSISQMFLTNFNATTLYLPGIELLTGLQLGISEQYVVFSEYISLTLLPSISLMFTEAFNALTLYQAGIDLIAGLETGITAQSPELLSTISDVCTSILEEVYSAFDIVLPEHSMVFHNISSLCIEGANDGIDDMSPSLLKTVQTLLDTILQDINKFKTTLFERIDKFIKNLQTKLTSIVTKVKNTISSIRKNTNTSLDSFFLDTKNKLNSFVLDIKNILNEHTLLATGSDLIQGLINGMISAHETLMSYISNETNNVLSAFIGNVTSFDRSAYQNNLSSYYNKVSSAQEDALQEFDSELSKIQKKYSKGGGYYQGLTFNLNGKQQSYYVNASSDAMASQAINAMRDAERKYNSTLNKLKSDTNSLLTTASGSSVGLNENTLYPTGINLIIGLIQGMQSKESDLFAYVDHLCSEITSRFNSALKIGSPSKLTHSIGEFLMLGLQEGIADKKDAVEKEFTDIDFSIDKDTFEGKFLDNISNMSTQAVSIFNDMADSIEEVINNLDLTYRLNKLNDIKLPKIASGEVLPSTVEFTVNKSKNDDAQLANTIKSAVIEGLSAMSYNNSNENEEIVINLDGYELFRAMRNRNDIFSHATGYSAF